MCVCVRVRQCLRMFVFVCVCVHTHKHKHAVEATVWREPDLGLDKLAILNKGVALFLLLRGNFGVDVCLVRAG